VDDLALETFRLLASETRLRLLLLLEAQSSGRPLCVTALSRHLGVTQEAVSQHLKRFEALGLVQGEQRGFRVHYRLDRKSLERCRQAVNEVLTIRTPPMAIDQAKTLEEV